MIEILKAKLQELNNLSQSLNDQLEQLRQQLNERPSNFLESLVDTSSDEDEDFVDIFSDETSVDSFNDSLSNHSGTTQEVADNNANATNAPASNSDAPAGTEEGADVVEQVERTVVNSLFELTSRLEIVRNQMRAVLNSGLVQEQNRLNDDVRISAAALDAIVNNNNNNSNTNNNRSMNQQEQPSESNNNRNDDSANNNEQDYLSEPEGANSVQSSAVSEFPESDIQSPVPSSHSDSDSGNQSALDWYHSPVTRSPVSSVDNDSTRMSSQSEDNHDVSNDDDEANHHVVVTQPPESPSASSVSGSDLATVGDNANSDISSIPTITSPPASPGSNDLHAVLSSSPSPDASPSHRSIDSSHSARSSRAMNSTPNTLTPHSSPNHSNSSVNSLWSTPTDDSDNDVFCTRKLESDGNSTQTLHESGVSKSQIDPEDPNSEPLHHQAVGNLHIPIPVQDDQNSSYHGNLFNVREAEERALGDNNGGDFTPNNYLPVNSLPTSQQNATASLQSLPEYAFWHENLTRRNSLDASLTHRENPSLERNVHLLYSSGVTGKLPVDSANGRQTRRKSATQVSKCEPDSTQELVGLQPARGSASACSSNSSTPRNYQFSTDSSDTDDSDSMKYITKRLRKDTRRERGRNSTENRSSQEGNSASHDSGVQTDLSSQTCCSTSYGGSNESRKRRYERVSASSMDSKKRRLDDLSNTPSQHNYETGDTYPQRNDYTSTHAGKRNCVKTGVSHKRTSTVQSGSISQDPNGQSLNVKIDLSLINYSGPLPADSSNHSVPATTVVHRSANIAPYYSNSRPLRQTVRNSNVSTIDATPRHTYSSHQFQKQPRYARSDVTTTQSGRSNTPGNQNLSPTACGDDTDSSSSDETWQPGSNPESDITVTEEDDCETDSSYEVQVPKSVAALLDEYASASSDESWTVEMS